MKEILAVGIGGFMGSVVRYAISLAVVSMGFTGRFPLATFAVNILGSLLIGAIVGRMSPAVSIHHYLYVVGFCGGFTTFSTFSLDALKLLKAGDFTLGLVYVLTSVVVCVCATWVGMLLTTKS